MAPAPSAVQRGRMKILPLLLATILLAACSSTGATPAAPTAAPATQAPARATPATEAPGSGVITFGRAFNTNSLLIIGAASTFKASSKVIAWSAELTGDVGATSVEWVIASINKAGAQQTLVKEKVDISDPHSDLLANKLDLAALLDREPGTYVMRYIRGGNVLAEGTFKLVK